MSHAPIYHNHSRSLSVQEGLVHKNSIPDCQEKERDSLLWQARWQAYEQKKKAWLDSSWAEYQERKEIDIKSRWQEYNDAKAARGTDQGKQTKPSRVSPGTPQIRASAGKDLTSDGFVKATAGTPPFTTTPSTPLSRSSSISQKPSTPMSPTRTPASIPLPKSTPSSPMRSSTLSSKYRPSFAPMSPIPTVRVPSHSRSSSLSSSQSWTQHRTSPLVFSSPPVMFKPKVSASDSDLPNKPNVALQDEERQRRERAQEHLRQYAIQEAARRKAQALQQSPIYPKRGKHSKPKPETNAPNDHRVKSENERLRSLEQEASRLDEARKAERIQQMREEQWRQDMKEFQERKLERERLAASVDAHELERQNALRESFKAYEERWQALYDGKIAPGDTLTFFDIPWPVLSSPSAPDGLDPELIKAFLLSPSHSSEKAGKLRVREAMLRFHPDRFEGRWIGRVRESDRLAVKEGVGRVVRALNETSARLAMA